MADNDDDLVDYDEEEVRLVNQPFQFIGGDTSRAVGCLANTGSDLSGSGRILA
jgi:hypothetical protein